MSGSKTIVPDQRGFTLVELTVVIAVTTIVAVVFLMVVSNYYVVISRNDKLSEMTVNSQNLMRSTVENIRYGNGVEQTNTLTDPNAPSGGWSTSNTNFVIIIPVPAVDSSKNWIIDPDTGSPYMNELVYYKSGSTLMQRTIANPSAVGNTLRTSCPPVSASASCPPDKQLATYVSSMTFTLYDQNGAATTTTSAARSIQISLTMLQNNPGNPISLSSSIRVTLRNRF